MLPVSQELTSKLSQLNHALKKSYPVTDPQKIRDRLKQVGTFHSIERWSHTEMKQWLDGQSVVGVDGSVNSIRGSQARRLSLFQALAKGTRGEEEWAADWYTPLIREEGEEENEEGIHQGALLSSLELEVALRMVRSEQTRVILTDGSLLHYQIDDLEGWLRLINEAEAKGVYLIGISEEIGTKGLAKQVFPEYAHWTDRDLLYGVLQVGEAYEWSGWDSGSLWKMVFRPSKSPQPIGLDGLLSQKADCFSLLQMVHALTPEQGRGIPYWLDIVDSQVRVTDALLHTLVDQYLEPEIRHRLFAQKRNDRII